MPMVALENYLSVTEPPNKGVNPTRLAGLKDKDSARIVGRQVAKVRAPHALRGLRPGRWAVV
jgi:hypothetical protein